MFCFDDKIRAKSTLVCLVFRFSVPSETSEPIRKFCPFNNIDDVLTAFGSHLLIVCGVNRSGILYKRRRIFLSLFTVQTVSVLLYPWLMAVVRTFRHCRTRICIDDNWGSFTLMTIHIQHRFNGAYSLGTEYGVYILLPAMRYNPDTFSVNRIQDRVRVPLFLEPCNHFLVEYRTSWKWQQHKHESSKRMRLPNLPPKF